MSQDAVNYVLDQFVATLKGQSSLGLGSSDYVEMVLKRALGEDKAASVMGRILPDSRRRVLKSSNGWMRVRSSDMVRNEHPPGDCDHHVCARLRAVALDVLSFLPPPIRPEILQRVAHLKQCKPAAMQELESIMKKQFSNSSARSSSVGGVKQVMKIMNFAKVDMETQVMEGLMGLDEDLAMAVQDNMFTFDTLD